MGRCSRPAVRWRPVLETIHMDEQSKSERVAFYESLSEEDRLSMAQFFAGQFGITLHRSTSVTLPALEPSASASEPLQRRAFLGFKTLAAAFSLGFVVSVVAWMVIK